MVMSPKLSRRWKAMPKGVEAGYRRHRWHHYEELVRDRLPQGIRGPVFGFLGSVYPKMDWAPQPLRAKSTLQALARDSVGGLLMLHEV